MNTRTAVALGCTALLALSACAAEDTGTRTQAPATSQESVPVKEPAPAPSAPVAATPRVDEETLAAEPETATLPDMTGKVLQTAQDEAQALGFYGLTSSDATGAGRFQVLDRNWRVCSQTPEPGVHPVETTVDFATVKLTESC
ncbi:MULTISPECIES: PASTA domain-containing protein [unclassified Streptomyces]|uniref:PASTA domain-containing protein n=1 Tax=unclassified Streptomyces TaxID=2593676 RepID=UPI00366292C5